MRRYIILLTASDDAWAKLSAEEQQRLMEKYFAWVDRLKKRKIYLSGEQLGIEGRVLRTVDGAVVDGPFTETKEVLTGLFVIKAPTLDAAVEIARGCPALTHGETVTVQSLGSC